MLGLTSSEFNKLAKAFNKQDPQVASCPRFPASPLPVEGTEIKRTRKTKASRNGTKRKEESKRGQNTQPQKQKRPKGDSRNQGGPEGVCSGNA